MCCKKDMKASEENVHIDVGLKGFIHVPVLMSYRHFLQLFSCSLISTVGLIALIVNKICISLQKIFGRKLCI